MTHFSPGRSPEDIAWKHGRNTGRRKEPEWRNATQTVFERQKEIKLQQKAQEKMMRRQGHKKQEPEEEINEETTAAEAETTGEETSAGEEEETA